MKTLRRKFIMFAMAAVTVLLVLLVTAINSMNVYLTNKQENKIMETLINSDGNFRFMEVRERPPSRRPLIPGPDMEMMRSTRFFIIKLDDDGAVSDINLDQIFSVTEQQAEEYADIIMKKGSKSGKIDRFRYSVKQNDEGTELFFVDRSRQENDLRVVFFVSTVIAALSWLLMLIFVILISGKVVQPIIAGYEKQKRFITDAGHELKTPLAIIQSNNDAMTLIHGENKYNRNIKSQVIRMNKLTADLLILAKYDEEIILQKELINIDELIAEIMPAYRDAAEARGLNFSVRISPNLVYQSHRESLTRLFTILLDNAVKYTVDDGKILFEIRKNGNRIIITEENTCEVPADNNTEQLFERFYRGDTARTQDSSAPGYGIGLSMGRVIAENLGGSLKADYISDKRIRFTAVI